jgi:hypothetical protein
MPTSTKTIFLPDKIAFPVISASNVQPATKCVIANGKMQVDIDLTTITSKTLTKATDYTVFYLREVESPRGVYAKTTDKAGVTTTPTAKIIVKDPAAPAVTQQNPPFDYISFLQDPTLPFNATTNPIEPLITKQLLPGNYTVVVRDGVTNCDSSPITINVLDKTNKAISISATPAATFCNTNDGKILVDKIEPIPNPNNGNIPFVYDYFWFKGGTQNTDFNFFNNTVLPKFISTTPSGDQNYDVTASGSSTVQVPIVPIGTVNGQYLGQFGQSTSGSDFKLESVPAGTRPKLFIAFQ